MEGCGDAGMTESRVVHFMWEALQVVRGILEERLEKRERGRAAEAAAGTQAAQHMHQQVRVALFLSGGMLMMKQEMQGQRLMREHRAPLSILQPCIGPVGPHESRLARCEAIHPDNGNALVTEKTHKRSTAPTAEIQDGLVQTFDIDSEEPQLQFGGILVTGYTAKKCAGPQRCSITTCSTARCIDTR